MQLTKWNNVFNEQLTSPDSGQFSRATWEIDMRKLILGLIGASALTLGSAASAAITIGSVTPGSSSYNGPAPTYDFDSSTPPTTGGAVLTGSDTVNLTHAQPLGSTGNYFVAGPTDGSPGVIDLSAIGDIVNISLLWGSVDWYNTLEFLDSANNVLATFTGSDIASPANGATADPNTNPVVFFNLTGSSVTDFSKLRLSSSQNAFEIDNIAINSGVPEPATWGMMLLGFAGMGMALRRRRRPVLAQVA
jgi:hypothetical protein